MAQEYTRYEIARILGARALQLSMNAPILIKISKEKLEEINYDPLKIAQLEFEGEVLPITVRRPLPRKIEADVEETKAGIEEIAEIKSEEKPEEEKKEGEEKPEEEKKDTEEKKEEEELKEAEEIKKKDEEAIKKELELEKDEMSVDEKEDLGEVVEKTETSTEVGIEEVD